MVPELICSQLLHRILKANFDNIIYLTRQPEDVLPPILSLAERGGAYVYIRRIYGFTDLCAGSHQHSEYEK